MNLNEHQGTLLDTRTVLTAGHCIVSRVVFTYYWNTYAFTVQTNSYYPTFESMYTVLHSL